MSRFTILELPTFTDARGMLTILEKCLPFSIERLFWIYGADGQARGGHRHRITRQALIALKGEVTVHMNDGVAQENIVLARADQCLLVEPKDWHTMSFEKDAILLALASHTYDPEDYVSTPPPTLPL